jgi:hypothetical protein
MKSLDDITAAWNRGEVAAFEAIEDLLPHFAREGIEAVLARIDPVLRERVKKFARIQDYDRLIASVRSRGNDPAAYIAMRDWIARVP